MVYRLKKIKYENRDVHILLQNENGPCPLLAAANALLLQGQCKLPSASIRNQVASLQDVSNMLAEQAMQAPDTDAIHVNELVNHIPKFQYGMDVNLKFQQGITGYEFTAELTAFDMLHVKLVHGWLVDPIQEPAIAAAVGTQTYNQIVERIIEGKEATTELEQVEQQLAVEQQLLETATSGNNQGEMDLVAVERRMHELERRRQKCVEAATEGALLESFLNATGHQLTQTGLIQLHEGIRPGELCVLFRNNHFGTVTKHQDGHLYLLVTDLGYANSPGVVWERLDVIDGDTEYFNSQFQAGAKIQSSGTTLTPEQLLATSHQRDVDYQLALTLSRMEDDDDNGAASSVMDDQSSSVANLSQYRGYYGGPPTVNSRGTYATGIPGGAYGQHYHNDGSIASTVQDTDLESTMWESVQKAGGGDGRKMPSVASNSSVVGVGVPVGEMTSSGASIESVEVGLPPSHIIARTTHANNNTAGGSVAGYSTTSYNNNSMAQSTLYEEGDRLLALQLQEESHAQGIQHDDRASAALAEQLQEEENQAHRIQLQERQAATAASNQSPRTRVGQRTFLGGFGARNSGGRGGGGGMGAQRPTVASGGGGAGGSGGNGQGCVIQ